jgi:hypothetical protein
MKFSIARGKHCFTTERAFLVIRVCTCAAFPSLRRIAIPWRKLAEKKPSLRWNIATFFGMKMKTNDLPLSFLNNFKPSLKGCNNTYKDISIAPEINEFLEISAFNLRSIL